MDYFLAVLLVLGSAGAWTIGLLGLPGNWLILVLAACYTQWGPARGRMDTGWWFVIGLIAVALCGEVIELLAGALGTTKAGGSKRSAVLALFGSLAGGLIGIGLGLPIPVIGSLVAAVLFAGLGALAGAVLGEQWSGRDLDAALRVGSAAFWSRLFGTLGKALCGAVMVVLVLVSLLV